jgi:hypothetical protein
MKPENNDPETDIADFGAELSGRDELLSPR